MRQVGRQRHVEPWGTIALTVDPNCPSLPDEGAVWRFDEAMHVGLRDFLRQRRKQRRAILPDPEAFHAELQKWVKKVMFGRRKEALPAHAKAGSLKDDHILRSLRA